METQQYILQIGAVVGRYRVVRHISSGGFGITYEVEHINLKTRCCMKEFFMRGINQRVGDSVTVSVEENRASFEQMRAKFLHEAQRMAQLKNPYVVRVTDCFEQNDTAYYVMDLINGRSLSDVMKAKGRAFTEAEVRQMLPQILDALRGIHDSGIYHLDLKPANIMQDKDGHLCLIDFGASKQMSLEETRTLSTSTALCYTPGFAPDELIQGASKYIGPWTDFYCLGATLYNLLTRETPPEAADVKYRSESAFRFPPSVSPQMQQLVRWLMQPDYPQRPKSVEEIEQRLKSIGQQSPVSPAIPNVSSNDTVRQQSKDTVLATWEEEPETDENVQKTAIGIMGLIFGALAVVAVIVLFVWFCDGNHAETGIDNPPVIDSVIDKPVEPIEEDKETTSVTCPDNNHPHMIDLGLPSGTLWSCCNVGASAPEEYGDYFAWGETRTKAVYSWDTYSYGNSSDRVKYIGSDIAGTEYDAATANWGAPWRMPTKEQCKELKDHCKFEWTTMNNVEGCKFTGPSEGTIFLPAGGFCWRGDGHADYAGSDGHSWSSTLYESNQYHAYRLWFKSEGVDLDANDRCDGKTVRPVRQN